jgi:hypothetical protein
MSIWLNNLIKRKKQKAKVNNLIDVLLNNPEITFEAMQEEHKKQQERKRKHKQETLNRVWYKLRDAIDDVTPLKDLWPIMMELKAAIDMGEDLLENEQFPETCKRLFGSYKEKPAQFSDILKEMQELYLKKNHDYGNSFSETIQEFGFTPAIARINDKLKRIKQMVKGEQMQVNESMRDNLIDIANYCILTIIELDNQKQNK